MRLDAANREDLLRAADLLRVGGIVAFPTETVYGLGANALDPNAVARIFKAKRRPAWDPLIVHVADATMLEQVANMPRGLPEAALESLNRAIERHWPGPLTLLLPRTPAVPDAVTAGRALVGVRMPAHPVALQLIRLAGVPLAAPSANLFGHTSPTTAAHVLADLDGRIDAVLDGGPCPVGVESTVAGITPTGFLVYRAGAVDLEGATVFQEQDPVRSIAPESLPSPGIGMRHYAPMARLLLVEGEPGNEAAMEQSLLAAVHQTLRDGDTAGVMLPDGWSAPAAALRFAWGPWSDLDTLARRLFAGLRELDDRGATSIVCPLPATEGLGRAIRDRLGKAARTS